VRISRQCTDAALIERIQADAARADRFTRNLPTTAMIACLGHKNIQHTVRYTELSPTRFKRDSPDDPELGRMFTVFQPSGKIEARFGQLSSPRAARTAVGGDLATFLGI